MNQLLALLPVLGAMVAHPAMAAPSPLVSRQEDWDGTQTGGIFCESRLAPNWGDCSTIMNGNADFGEGDTPNVSVCVSAGTCNIYTEGNCRISFCNNESFEICDPASTWGGRARDIEANCDENTGGYQSTPPPEPWSEVAIRLNTDWRLMSTGPAYKELSVEENKEELRALFEDRDSIAAQSPAHNLQRRQEERFTDVVISYNVYKPGSAVWVGRVVDDGEYEVTTSESKTFSVTSSVTLSASAWDVISAEIGVESSYSTTQTNTVSVTLNINCGGGTGQVYWRPFFDEYSGTLASSGQQVTIWVPKDTEASRMNYDYQCSG